MPAHCPGMHVMRLPMVAVLHSQAANLSGQSSDVGCLQPHIGGSAAQAVVMFFFPRLPPRGLQTSVNRGQHRNHNLAGPTVLERSNPSACFQLSCCGMLCPLAGALWLEWLLYCHDRCLRDEPGAAAALGKCQELCARAAGDRCKQASISCFCSSCSCSCRAAQLATVFCGWNMGSSRAAWSKALPLLLIRKVPLVQAGHEALFGGALQPLAMCHMCIASASGSLSSQEPCSSDQHSTCQLACSSCQRVLVAFVTVNSVSHLNIGPFVHVEAM